MKQRKMREGSNRMFKNPNLIEPDQSVLYSTKGSDQSQEPNIKVGHAGCECSSANTTVGGIQKAEARLAMTARGSVGSSHCAHGTYPHICERHQPTDTVATNNHFRHVRKAKVRMPCCSEEKAQQLSRTERAGSPDWRHSIRACSGQNI